jgi:hypothetical protein
MSNVVNLGRARKRKREAAEKQRADENAIRHGRTKPEKAREHMDQARYRAIVDGARLEPAGGRGDADAADAPPHASDDEPEA